MNVFYLKLVAYATAAAGTLTVVAGVIKNFDDIYSFVEKRLFPRFKSRAVIRVELDRGLAVDVRVSMAHEKGDTAEACAEASPDEPAILTGAADMGR